MGLPVEVNNLMMGAVGGYQISRSLRFRASAQGNLSRTLSVAGNRRILTISAWVKWRGIDTGSASDAIYSVGPNNSTRSTGISFIGSGFSGTSGAVLQVQQFNGSTQDWQLITTPVYRDPAAWYHVVVAIDTSQATASNRVKLWINGVQVTAFASVGASPSYPSQNSDTDFGSTSYTQYIGRDGYASASNRNYDGYMAEYNYIDGQALTPSSFGAYDTNGVWQPKKYTGTYGTNGFYLPFSDTTSTTTLVQDSSGNGNNWTPNNISLTAGTTYDSMIDSPTNSASSSNYCVWNPNWKDSTLTISDGNLKVSSASNSNGLSTGTIAVSSGKWYWEATVGGSVSLWAVGIISTSVATPNYSSLTTGNSYAWNNGATKYNGQTGTSYGATYTTGDVLGVALDLDGGTITFYKNNTSQGTAFTGISGTFTPMSLMNASSDVSTNFGQRPFTYTPPSGYNALNTYNLPAPSIANGAQYMAATLYTGNGTSQSISNAVNGVSFQPDFVWYKDRSVARDHALFNVISGATYLMSSNNTSAESAVAGTLTSFNSNGYSIGSAANANANGETYVGWQWKGGGTGVTNNSGTITSTVSASPSSGFSIATYTGTGANATVGHGLGVAPSMVIVKGRSYVSNWNVWHTSLTSAAYDLQLNTTTNQFSSPTMWNSTAPTSSVFSIGTSPDINVNGSTYVAYCFSAVSGYSAFGKWTGNGSSDGPFVFTNFRPRYVMWKRTDVSGDGWWIVDSSRNTYNVATQLLFAQSSTSETAITTPIDFLSNGFKLRNGADGSINGSGGTYIYMAFAENPFSIARAR